MELYEEIKFNIDRYEEVKRYLDSSGMNGPHASRGGWIYFDKKTNGAIILSRRKASLSKGKFSEDFKSDLSNLTNQISDEGGSVI